MSSRPANKKAIPTAPVLRALRLFVVLFTFLAECLTIGYNEIVWDRLYRMLPMAAGYAIAVIIARRHDHWLTITSGGIILAGAAALLGFDALSWIFNGALAVIGFGNALRERVMLKRLGDKPDNIFFAFLGLAALVLMLIVSWISGSELSGRLVFTMIMVYFPLAFCTWLYEGIDYYVGQFANRSTQPVSAVRRNVSEWIIPVVLFIAVAAALMPQKDGRTLAYYVYRGLTAVFAGIVYFLGRITDLFSLDNAEESIISYSQLEPNQPGFQSESGISDRIAAIFAFSVLAVFALSIVITLVKKLLQAIIAGYSMRPSGNDDDISGNDVIERITPGTDSGRRRIFSRPTTAEKIRGIYKNTVAGLSKHGLKPADSDSPDEICAAAGELGFDLTELTGIYKQARYTPECDEALLHRARFLSGHIEKKDT